MLFDEPTSALDPEMVKAVSYTHLDVYKRQCPWLCMDIPDIRTWPGKGRPRQPFYRMETDMINRLVWMETDNTYPVSYTHLDVYKRQASTILVIFFSLPSMPKVWIF